MRWLDGTRGASSLACAYCGTTAALPHKASFLYYDREFHLHKCLSCESYVYDFAGERPPGDDKLPIEEHKIGLKYYFEAGYSAEFIVRCALAALPQSDSARLSDYNFFDVGAGTGLGSYLVRKLFSMGGLAIEPSWTGQAAKELFRIDLEQKYFEEVDADLLRRIAQKPCLVYLNSVIEHIADPRKLLDQLLGTIDVMTVAALVPDAEWIDRSAPFLSMVPFLAPGDHLHLPTREGMQRLLADIGLPHQTVYSIGSLIMAVGSREPVIRPSEMFIGVATSLLLERLLEHSHPHVSRGAAARLLPKAVMDRDLARVDVLKRKLQIVSPGELINAIENRSWNDIPFHTASVCYWLAVDEFLKLRFEDALTFLSPIKPFSRRLARDYPQYALETLIYKWEAEFHRAQIFLRMGRAGEAQAIFSCIIVSASDAMEGAPKTMVERAETALRAMSDSASCTKTVPTACSVGA
jgi:hypothetical protein